MSEIPFGSDHILRLPSAPVYMSIMKTISGKPEGNPLWTSFISKDNLSLENENVSSTLISLSKNIGDLASDSKKKDGKVIHIAIEKRSYNIYLPSADSEFQISFVVVFESSESILVEDKHRKELVRLVVTRLSKLISFLDYLSRDEELIERNNPLHREIQNVIADILQNWDKKRVKYLIKEEEKERRRLAKFAKKEEEKRLASIVEENPTSEEE